ncbi:hypothetical protein HKX48_007108 [Thoreauomyces humboldtii]|nr:hypothetical protein HKX48_007108 [Thoreauomyces humboldtii]
MYVCQTGNTLAFNRLKSVADDALFVTKVAEKFSSLPIVPNERCGSWYIDPTKANGQSVYFKSTDGHHGQWSFNLRRLNYHILATLCQQQGLIIVDSTRNGKRIPDSLSKTVPIWCCVINNAVASMHGTPDIPTPSFWDTRLHSPPGAVSASESEQMRERIPGFVQKLLASTVNIRLIAKQLSKPLRPIWITPASTLDGAFDWAPDDLVFSPIVLVSASQAVPDGVHNRPGYTYVQGSADDHELWSEGLTPQLFWKYRDLLLAASTPTACREEVLRIVAEQKAAPSQSLDSAGPATRIGNTRIFIGNRASAWPPTCFADYDLVINCGAPEHDFSDKETRIAAGQYLYLPIPEGKKGQQALYQSLDSVLESVRGALRDEKRILIHCMQGKDRPLPPEQPFKK